MIVICQNARVLARYDQHRYIAVCDCCGGTVHIMWDAATVRLPHAEMPTLQRALDNMAFRQPHQRIYCNKQTLWFGSVGIRLTCDDYDTLRHLVASVPGQVHSLERLPHFVN